MGRLWRGGGGGQCRGIGVGGGLEGKAHIPTKFEPWRRGKQIAAINVPFVRSRNVFGGPDLIRLKSADPGET